MLHWKIVNGNKTMLSTSCVCLACLAMGVPLVLEKPRLSMIWRTRELLALTKRLHVRFSHSDFCQWGTPWRKATAFLPGFCNTTPIENNCQNGICTCSGHRHQVLAGIDPVSKCFGTHVAEPYPRGLSRGFAKMLHDAVAQRTHEKLGAIWGFS